MDRNSNYRNYQVCKPQTLAMAQVEIQTWQKIYDPEKGFNRGTIFSELDLPFLCEEGCR